MNFRVFIALTAIFAAVLTLSCSHNIEKTEHEEHNQSEAENAEEVKFQYSAYSNNFELFAEADAFIIGEKSNVLSHFTVLPQFKAVEKCVITISLSVNGNEIKQTVNEPVRKGIYSFDIEPGTVGEGTLAFEITGPDGPDRIAISGVKVFENEDEAQEAYAKLDVSKINAISFTKEQSWKIDFATALPSTEPFGQVIKTTALVQSSQSSEMVISATTSGIVLFNPDGLLLGSDIKAGQELFTLSGSNMAENNIAVMYTEAKSNYEKANADYERSMELAKDKIISEKDLLTAKNQFEKAEVIFENLSKNFHAEGQKITSPKSGFLKQIFIKNGAYVEAGQPVVVVSQNKSLVLNAEVPVKYAPVLANIQSANIRAINDNRSFTLEQLKGKVLSYGKAANSDNFLIPVILQIENNGTFVAGSFIEVYLKAYSDNTAIVVPQAALLEEQGNFFVWVQVTPELFEKREVFIGGTDGINTEIKGGLSANERIVTRGAMLIKLAQSTGTLDAHSGHIH